MISGNLTTKKAITPSNHTKINALKSITKTIDAPFKSLTIKSVYKQVLNKSTKKMKFMCFQKHRERILNFSSLYRNFLWVNK